MTGQRLDWHRFWERSKESRTPWAGTIWLCSSSWTKTNTRRVRLDHMKSILLSQVYRLFLRVGKLSRWQISVDLLEVLNAVKSLKWSRKLSLLPTRIDQCLRKITKVDVVRQLLRTILLTMGHLYVNLLNHLRTINLSETVSLQLCKLLQWIILDLLTHLHPQLTTWVVAFQISAPAKLHWLL